MSEVISQVENLVESDLDSFKKKLDENTQFLSKLEATTINVRQEILQLQGAMQALQRVKNVYQPPVTAPEVEVVQATEA